MEKRRLLPLALCAIETLRCAAAYFAFLPAVAAEALGTGHFSTAALFAPQLLIPLAWFLVWNDEAYYRPLLGMTLAGKAMLLAAEAARVGAFIVYASGDAPLEAGAARLRGSFQALILFADICLVAVSLIASRTIFRSKTPGQSGASGGVSSPGVGEGSARVPNTAVSISQPSGAPYQGPEAVGVQDTFTMAGRADSDTDELPNTGGTPCT
jgi:hypothetical protein